MNLLRAPAIRFEVTGGMVFASFTARDMCPRNSYERENPDRKPYLEYAGCVRMGNESHVVLALSDLYIAAQNTLAALESDQGDHAKPMFAVRPPGGISLMIQDYSRPERDGDLT